MQIKKAKKQKRDTGHKLQSSIVHESQTAMLACCILDIIGSEHWNMVGSYLGRKLKKKSWCKFD